MGVLQPRGHRGGWFHLVCPVSGAPLATFAAVKADDYTLGVSDWSFVGYTPAMGMASPLACCITAAQCQQAVFTPRRQAPAGPSLHHVA